MLLISLIGLGTGSGALCRYLITTELKKHSGWPVATLLINLSGSLVLGFLFGLDLPLFSYKILGIGFLGGYTTFSTFNVELTALLNSQQQRLALFYAAASYLGGLLFVWLGFSGGRLF